MPSATPEPAEIEAWNALPRDAQVARLRETLTHPDCSTPTDATMQDVLRAARERAKRDDG